jgi:hypothetical protein
MCHSIKAPLAMRSTSARPDAAGLMPASAAATLATAAGRLACRSAASSSAGPGGCVASIGTALAAANMTAQIRCDDQVRRCAGAPREASRRPSQWYTTATSAPPPPAACRALRAGLDMADHPGYQQLCAGIRLAGCCAVAWARLAAATARQLCRDALAEQLLLLPSSCGLGEQALCGGETVSAELQPLLQQRQGCAAAPGGGGTSSGSISSNASTSSAGGSGDYWGGAACSALQRSRARCPATASDLWCGYLSDLDAAGERGQAAAARPHTRMTRHASW